jgi:hypothetical protein
MNERPQKSTKGHNKDIKPLFGLNPVNGQPIVTVDYKEFESYLEEQDLTEDQKRELLQTLWNIVVAFIDFGFEIHPIQLALNDGGKLDEIDFEQGFERDCVIHSKDIKITSKYERASKPKGDTA